MIKRFSIRKIGKYTILLLVVFLFYLFPKKDNYVISKEVSFNKEAKTHEIFLIDKNDYIAKTNIEITSKNKEKMIDELVELLIIDGKYQDKIPNGFRPIIPEGTKLIDKELINNKLILNFNDELLKTKKEMEEKIVESLIYTLTSLKGIDQIQIKIDGNILEKLPKTGKELPNELKRDFGINKIYDITGIKNISKVIIYYAAKTNDNNIYYVPVTKYTNDNMDKIKIIIDELTSKISYESNLISYLNYNAKLLDYSFNEEEIDLNFNEYLFDNTHDKKVLEEVIYSISYSLKDNFNVSKINFYVNNEEIK